MESPYHIINEYGILKNILSYLTCKELRVVAEVNSNWKKVANIIIQEHVKIIAYIKETSWPKLSDKILPKVVIYNNDTKKTDLIKLTRKEFPDVNRCLRNNYEPEDYYFIYLSNWKFIHTLNVGKSSDIAHSFNEEVDCDEKYQNKLAFKESLLIIPEFDDLKVECELIDQYGEKQIDFSSVINKMRDSKCCLIFTSMTLTRTNKIIKNICDSAQKNGRDVVMAGGICQYIMGHEEGGDQLITSGGAIITFNGDHLSAKSFVISFRDDLTSSFSKMANEVGPLESGYTRLGFIFTCVERYTDHLEEETKEFSKFFPGVQLNGFWSYGEFCLGYSKHKTKMWRTGYVTSKQQQFFFQRSSVYLIITFKH